MNTAEIHCIHCQADIPAGAQSCPSCKQALAANDGTTIDAPALPERVVRLASVPHPDPDAVPSWLVTFRIVVVSVALLVVAIAWRTNRLDRVMLLTEWRGELAAELAKGGGRTREQPDDGRIHRGFTFYVGRPEDLEFFAVMPRPPRYVEAGTPMRVNSRRDIQREENGAAWIVAIGRPASLSARYIIDGVTVLAYSRWSLLVGSPAKWTFAIVLLLVPLLDRVVIARYRRRQRRNYEEYERAATERAYRAQEHLTRARQHAAEQQVAKALTSIREALQLLPSYPEALELKRQLELVAAEQASVTVGDFGQRFARPAAEASQILYLRVVGTPYAYRAEAGASTIRVGRQRPKEAEEGNDLVIRVPASDDKTLRISRRHLDINRIADDYFVVDLSGGNTRLNGRVLEGGKPSKIASGDRLLLADVLTLEVAIRSGTGKTAARIIQLGEAAARFQLEATVGDMLTEV